MHFKEIFLNFYNSLPIQNFIKNINSIDRGIKDINKTGYPSKLSTLISFNFRENELLNFKIYCEIFRKFKKYEILKFLPTDKEFSYYFNYWDTELPSSLCFGIKVNTNHDVTQYFHIKLNCVLREFTECKIYKTRPSFTRTGISYEYTKEQIKKKYYFYYTKTEDIEFFKNTYNLVLENGCIDHIEFTEFDDGEQKIIVVYSYKNEAAYSNIQKEFFQYNTLKQCVEYFVQDHNLLPCYFGVYKNNTIALYWSITEVPLNGVLNIDPLATESKLKKLLSNV